MSSALPDSRRASILEQLDAEGEVRVSSLATELGVSPITIRRDLAHLAREERLEQVRGGARRTSAGSQDPRSGDAVQATIAIVAPSLRYYWPTIVGSARRTASREDARLLIQPSSATAAENLSVLDQLADDPAIDALIIAPDLDSGPTSTRVVERLQGLQLPVVLIERSIRALGRHGVTFDSVRTDHVSGAAMALRHLADLGHENVALLCDPFSPTRPLLEEGFARASEDLGADAAATHIGTIDTHGATPFETIDEFLRQCVRRGTTAALVHSDEAALLLLQHAQRRGWSIPHDFSVISYDDELAELAHPPLTAVAPAKEALGDRAVMQALKRLQVPDAPIERVELLPTVTVRASTAAPPARRS